MTSAASPAGAARQRPSPVSPRSHESGEECERQKMEQKLLVHFLQGKQKQTKTNTSKNYTLSRFFQSMINQSCLCSSSHCLSTLAPNSPADLLMVLDFWIQLSRALLSFLIKEGIH